MKRCKNCVMPDTRPGLTFNEQGVCQACQRHEERKNIDWDRRQFELVVKCDSMRERMSYSSNSQEFDCLITVSGGKDSHYQVYILKEMMHLNPLLVNVSNLPGDWSYQGEQNFANIKERFDCECISLHLSPARAKKLFRYCFEAYGSPTWYWDRAVYTFPLYIAKNFGIPTVFYGENISWQYGGPEAEDTPSAMNQLVNNVASSLTIPSDLRSYWMDPPELDESIDPQYLSYYLPWSGSRNLMVAKAHGFQELLHELRSGFVEQYDQIDAWGYLVHAWMKYPKYGHARVTDVTSYWIREGLMTRREAMELVRKYDGVLDKRIREYFCNFCGYTEEQFWTIVDKFYNRDLFREERGKWILIEDE